jgi:hypothetical protein
MKVGKISFGNAFEGHGVFSRVKGAFSVVVSAPLLDCGPGLSAGK